MDRKEQRLARQFMSNNPGTTYTQALLRVRGEFASTGQAGSALDVESVQATVTMASEPMPVPKRVLPQYLKDLSPETTPVEMVMEIRRRKELDIKLSGGAIEWSVPVQQSRFIALLRQMICFAQTGQGMTQVEFQTASEDIMLACNYVTGEREDPTNRFMTANWIPGSKAPWMENLVILRRAYFARQQITEEREQPFSVYIIATLSSMSEAHVEVELEESGVVVGEKGIGRADAITFLRRHGVAGLPNISATQV